MQSASTCNKFHIYKKENTLILTEEEKNFIKTLENFTKQRYPTIVMRIAGGWVRDKLLGISCQDIDIALNQLTGLEFAQQFALWLEKEIGHRPTVSTIKANPAQSKHLETAKMRFQSFELDFIHLRSEVYSNANRIPEIIIGTPKEDAFRRDFTINTLFYNIKEGCVEDFTGKGMSDLQEKIIKTPLNPHTTFMDDPLRLLRGIRFACTLNFKLDPSILIAAQSRDVRRALEAKVSAERKVVELEKMFLGDCRYAIRLLCNETQIADVVFGFDNARLLKGSFVFELLPYCRRLQDGTRRVPDKSVSIDIDDLPKSIWIPLVYATLLCEGSEAELKHSLEHTLKVTNKTFNFCKNILAGSHQWINFLDSCITNTPHTLNFIELDSQYAKNTSLCLKLLLRHMGENVWEAAIALAIAYKQDLKSIGELITQQIRTENLREFISKKCPMDGHQLLELFPGLSGVDCKNGLQFALQACLAKPELFTDIRALGMFMKRNFNKGTNKFRLRAA